LGKAIELSPSYTKAHYDLAQYYAVTGDAERAIPFLQKAVEQDSPYFNLAEREQNFNPIRDAVLQLLRDIKRDAYEKTKKGIANVEDALKDAEYLQAKVYALQEYGAAKAKLVLAMDKFNSGVYNAILEAKPIAMEAYELANKNRYYQPCRYFLSFQSNFYYYEFYQRECCSLFMWCFFFRLCWCNSGF
jgi:tetratricopeptide (TPR) repeat protein